jgi:UDP-glucose 4-epimerase
MRVVITGATGNVGSSLVERLGADPAVDTIVGLARRRPDWSPPKTTWVTADIATADLRPHLEGADAVVHLAWLFHPMRKPAVTAAVNVHGSARVFRAVADAGVRRLVHASSVGAYSPGPKDRPVDESWPTDGWPAAAYAREKAYVERLLDSFEHEHPEVRVVRLRPGFIFKWQSASQQRRLFLGPFVPARLLRPGLIPLVPDFPGLRFQALHSHDVAAAYRRAVVDDAVRGAFNLAADPVIDAEVLARLLHARIVPVPRRAVRAALTAAFRVHAVPVAPPLLDVLAHVPLMAVSRARRELGWQPEHSATAALAEALAGMRAAGGAATPPLDPQAGGRLREREIATGVGSRA